MMQVGGADASGFRDVRDVGLRAPIATDVSNGAPHHIIVRGCVGERRKVGDAIG
jgi:hypothetical protein